MEGEREMDKQEYAQYLLGLMDEEADAEEIDEDMFYGYFQMYMPSGEGVERTFSPLPDGEAYQQRIVQIYEMLDPKEFAGNTVPGYFNGKSEAASEDLIQAYGSKHIAELKQLLEQHADEEYTAEAIHYLGMIDEVVVLPPGKFEQYRKQYEPLVHDTLFELISEHSEDDEPVEILSEAFYSIACDYWISYYLQWHRYGLGGDPLAPYFELYRLGYSATFAGNKLYLGA